MCTVPRMSQSATLALKSLGPDDTCHLARSLAPNLTAGDTLLLSGDVGAGKTHFARCVILALLERPEDIPSPTYTLVQTYHGATCELWHADLYRLGDVSEIEELGLIDAIDAAITLIEWPDRLAGLWPEHALHIRLAPGEDDETREVTLTWSDPRWADKVKALRND